MAPPEEQQYDERLLVRYLLGSLSREETERFDELSIVDDEFASRLAAAENDLVDAYVRKELSPGDQERFQSSYLSSSRRRQKVDFAEKLRSYEPVVQSPQPEAVTAGTVQPEPVGEEPSARRSFAFGWVPRFAFALATVLLVACGYLVWQNLQLHKEMNDAQARATELQKNQRQLERQVDQQRSDIQKQLEQVRSAPPNLGQIRTVSMLLMPPMRGAARIPTLSVPSGANLAVVVLTLEADDFPAYRAALKDPAGDRELWQSENLESSAAGDRKVVSISFPADLLKQQNYLVELTGIPKRGVPERIAAYPFRAMLKSNLPPQR